MAEIGLLDEAIDEFRLATELRTDFAEAFNNLGNALKTRGDLDGAIGAYRAAVMLRPEVATGHSNLIFSMLYDAKNDAKAIAAETAEWDRRYGQPLASSILPHENDREPDRKLRIGYVSPDFRKHVVGQNLLPLFNHHNRGEFEIFCYAQVAAPDAMTARFEKMADHWLSIVGMTDEEAAARIRKDRIDILVDLAMHSGDNRLLVFARKPAPVQVCCFAYPGTTGLSAMDYRLTDPHLDPPGMFDEFYSEKSVRLADSWWCYEPLEEAQGREPAVGLLPAIGNGFVTFGCLNNYCKISDQTLDLWARVLQKVPTARVMLDAAARDGEVRIGQKNGGSRRCGIAAGDGRSSAEAQIPRAIQPHRHRVGHAALWWPHDEPGFLLDGRADRHVGRLDGRGTGWAQPVAESGIG